MYRAYCDGVLFFDPRSDSLKLTTANVNLELNKTGAFTFTMPPYNPQYNALHKLKSIITVYDDNELIFRGRVLNDESGFFNEKQVTCEGELAFFLDSIMRPYSFEGTPEEYLRMLVENHNSQVDADKEFIVGNVTVTDGDITNEDNKIIRSDINYVTTLELIQKKLIGSLGGYLWVRHEADGNYIDYLADFNLYNYTQSIEIGKNLLDVSRTVKGEDVATAIIPIGGSGESKLTIADLPDGEVQRIDLDGEEDIIYKSGDYVYSSKGVERYGWIFKSVTWNDVKVNAHYLQTVAVNSLVSAVNLNARIELTAGDLAGIQDVNPFRLATRIKVFSEHHDLNALFLIEKLSLNLLKPSDNKLTVGKSYHTFTETTLNTANATNQLSERITAAQLAISEASEQNTSLISQSATEILTQISQDYYLKTDAEQLVESVNTQFQQTNEEFEFRFNDFALDLNDVQQGTAAQFQQISKYIRFVDGNIILGENGNELTLKIQSDRISFLQSGLEVAYFSNRKLYVTDGEFLNSLHLGNFAFIPRANGNLSFKKVT